MKFLLFYCPVYRDLRLILLKKKTCVLGLDLIGIEDGAVIVSLSDYVFAFSEYVSKALDRGRTVT